MNKLVFTNGCFDLLHDGHIYLLTRASEYGILVVGVNSDRSVRRLKGPGRPVHDQWKRMSALEALGCVSDVFIFDEDTPMDLISMIKPDIIVKGSDYTEEDVVGCSVVPEVILVPLLEGHSTTKIIESEGGDVYKSHNGGGDVYKLHNS